MKSLFIIPLLLLLATAASATIVISIAFAAGTNIQHNVSNISATAGVPVAGAKYYFTSTTPYQSTDGVNAIVVSQAKAAGKLVYNEIEKVGNCNFKAIVGGTVISTADLNGTTVADGTEIKWAAEPTSGTATVCRLTYDMNVVI